MTGEDLLVRYIPTRVGRTDDPIISIPMFSVHPHSRGENSSIFEEYTCSCGTSPLAWGELGEPIKVLAFFRYIPTRVGRTDEVSLRHLVKAVHPHSRGENVVFFLPTVQAFGTSPLAWGEREPYVVMFQLRRYIPTRVGRTSDSWERRVPIAVHPHSRGENTGN